MSSPTFSPGPGGDDGGAAGAEHDAALLEDLGEGFQEPVGGDVGEVGGSWL